MKIYYDQNHTPPRFKVGQKAFIHLSKKSDKGYHLQNQTKLSFTKVGPLPILRSHGPLAFELKIPPTLKGIHPVISAEYLEPALSDPYKRAEPEPGPIHIHGEERYIIKNIIGKEMRKGSSRKRELWYHVK